MKIAILGYGAQGRAAYEYWHTGHDITICDRNEKLAVPPGAHVRLGQSYLEELETFDIIVRGPGIHPREITAANSANLLEKVTTVTNEFFKVCPTKNIIGITGTKGKGTTSTLIAKMLETDGHRVHLGGNIGTPPLDLLKDGIKPDDWVVLELANFQLIDLNYSPRIAVCLAVVPEHLDWHDNIEDYTRAKSRLFAHQSSGDIAIYFSEDEVSKRITANGHARKVPYYAPPGAIVDNGSIGIDGQVICRTDELKLPGRHNWQNICAAVTAVWQVSQDVGAIHSVLTTFTSLEHRIEFVREVGGIRFYNDSYAAGLQAAEAAIEAIDGKKVMILGGYDRMLDIEHFGPYALDHQDEFRTLLLIGASAKRLAGSLKQAGFTNYNVNSDAKTMPAVVTAARELAKPGDAIVLSPGFASFDMFKNFTERGRQFKVEVQKL